MDRLFGHWVQFCQELGQPPSLGDLPSQNDRLSYLLVFGYRYRQRGRTNRPVRTDQVDKALLAVGQGIARLGQPDPRLQAGTTKLHPLLSDFLRALRKEDDPQTRAYPANITILRAIPEALDLEHAEEGVLNQHTFDLIIVAFYWLLRPAEYLETPEEGRSQAFLFQHISLTIDGINYPATEAPLNDARSISRIEYAALTFADQKNATKGETVGHASTNDPVLCPAKALGRIARRLLRWRAQPNTPIHRHYNDHPKHRKWYSIKSQFVTNALRWAARLKHPTTGIPLDHLSARSLRPGGATALLCAGVDTDIIQLLGRWKSDAMFRYLRIQAHTHSSRLAQRMLDHGAYTFAPQACDRGDLPQQANPAMMAAVLGHDELYD